MRRHLKRAWEALKSRSFDWYVKTAVAVLGVLAAIVTLRPVMPLAWIGVGLGALALLVVMLVGAVGARTRRQQLSELRNAFAYLIDHYRVPYIEDLTIRWHIGESDQHDWLQRVHKTWTEAGDPPLLWRYFEVWGMPGSNRVPSLRELKLKVTADEGAKHECQVLVLEAREWLVRGVVLFDPPLNEEPLTWILELHWPGLWAPLRRNGKDTSTFIGEPPPWTVSKLEIEFIFPPGARPEWVHPQTDPKRTVVDGRILRWSTTHPTPMPYKFEVQDRTRLK